MRKEVLVCDKCLKHKSNIQSFSWKTGASFAGLDGRQEDEVLSIDLCKACVTDICVTDIIAVHYPELPRSTLKATLKRSMLKATTEDDVGE